MKNVVWSSAIIAACIFACFASVDTFLYGPGCVSSIAMAEEGDAPPPLVVDKNNPLLLKTGPDVEEPEKTVDPMAQLWGPPPAPEANNKLCLVCHKNFEKEELVKDHSKANVACTKCHGESDAHSADEDNVTPPDKIYGRGAIDKMCAECHDEHDVPGAKVVARWLERTKDTPAPEGQAVCTDCHGYHRLQFRTVRWDKETRELIINEPGTTDEEDGDTMQ